MLHSLHYNTIFCHSRCSCLPRPPPIRIAGHNSRVSPLPPSCIGLRSSDPHPTQQTRPPSPSCTSLLPYYLLTATTPAGCTDAGGDRSSSIAPSCLCLLLRYRSHPPPHPLCRYHPEGGGGGGYGTVVGIVEDQVFLRGLDYRGRQNGGKLYAGYGSGVCGRTVAAHPILAQKITTPPVRVPSPLERRYSHIQTS